MTPQANFIFWVEIGRRMNMKDIPQTIDELEQFAEVRLRLIPVVLG